ncbi:MAG: PepSY domain-containing protein [Burkholderiales bacterium]
MRFRRFIRQAHRWLGLLIGIQLLLWVTGGVVMSALRLEEVRGEHRAAKATAVSLDSAVSAVPIADILQRYADRHPTSVTLTRVMGQPVYRLDGSAGGVLVDATSGGLLSPLPQSAAEAIARADYQGDGAFAGTDWVETPALEYRGRDLPLWRVRFNDRIHTTVYVSPATGAIAARRNDLWRVFDFVWMLHIMDYQGREDFNHPLLVTAAATALLFVFTGLVMLIYSFRPVGRPGAEHGSGAESGERSADDPS